MGRQWKSLKVSGDLEILITADGLEPEMFKGLLFDRSIGRYDADQPLFVRLASAERWLTLKSGGASPDAQAPSQ